MNKRRIYLGKKVKDIGKNGLDKPSEYMAIAREILGDYKKGRIKPATARGRLLLLFHLVDKNKKLKATATTKRKLKEYIRNKMREIKKKRKKRRKK